MEQRDGIGDALVIQAQQGDAQAQETLLARLTPVLRAYFIDRAGFRAEVDDLIQNTLLRVHQGLPDLKDPARLKAFAMKAALFEVQDFYRGRYSTKERLLDPEAAPPEPKGPAPNVAQRVDLERALATLTPKAREIIALRERGYRYAEIAQLTETTEAAVKMQVKRAFEKMRGVLAALLALLLG